MMFSVSTECVLAGESFVNLTLVPAVGAPALAAAANWVAILDANKTSDCSRASDGEFLSAASWVGDGVVTEGADGALVWTDVVSTLPSGDYHVCYYRDSAWAMVPRARYENLTAPMLSDTFRVCDVLPFGATHDRERLTSNGWVWVLIGALACISLGGVLLLRRRAAKEGGLFIDELGELNECTQDMEMADGSSSDYNPPLSPTSAPPMTPLGLTPPVVYAGRQTPSFATPLPEQHISSASLVRPLSAGPLSRRASSATPALFLSSKEQGGVDLLATPRPSVMGNSSEGSSSAFAGSPRGDPLMVNSRTARVGLIEV
eukprot:TRINITY_DN141_c0_g1_i6.p1 TRINITY_DN141_c0_g1~~TRINITY_DN141_c0_g1_i6.p1  ORF type:complete len:317 (+),score=33.65 TRINITY_DN141_c0_g1_i6:343-1293(+)